MATGALNNRGIWLYGEDDSEATFSALLNKLGSSVSNAPGRILQVKSAYPYQTFSTTSTSNVATSLTLSITPTSTTSKIIIGIYAGTMWTSAAGSYAFGTIYAGTSSGSLTRDLGVGSPMSSVNANNSSSAAPLGIVAIDNPTTTSTLYYTYAMRTSTGSSAGLAYNSTITLMEVSA